mgnify:CR=1 FL=1
MNRIKSSHLNELPKRDLSHLAESAHTTYGIWLLELETIDYAIYVVSAPNTSKKGENVKQGWDMAFS